MKKKKKQQKKDNQDKKKNAKDNNHLHVGTQQPCKLQLPWEPKAAIKTNVTKFLSRNAPNKLLQGGN